MIGLRCISLFSVLMMMAGGEPESPVGSSFVLLSADPMPKPGTKHVVTKVEELKNGKVKAILGGETREGTCESSQTETVAFEFISPDKIRRVETVTTKNQVTKIVGVENPQSASSPLLNIPVVMTRSGDIWKAALESGTPNLSQSELLSAMKPPMNARAQEEATYGKTPRKVGESWSVRPMDFSYAGASDADTGEVKITFKGIETHEGMKCARLEATVRVEPKDKGNKNVKKIIIHGSCVILRSLEECIDLKVDFNVRMEAEDETMSLTGELRKSETVKVN